MKTFAKLIDGKLDILSKIPHVSSPFPKTIEKYALENGYKEYKSSNCSGEYYHHEYVEVEDYITDSWVKYSDSEMAPIRCAELHQKLEETDYIASKLAEVDGKEREEMLEHYTDILAQRKAWREEIRSLENKI